MRKASGRAAADVRTSEPETMPELFPGRVVKAGETNKNVVKALQRRLNEVGCGPLEVDGDFGSKTRGAVKLFQARTTDLAGLPLKADGEVGPITWAALFGADAVPVSDTAPSPLLAQALEIAASQIGVHEDPAGSNRGPEVDEYLRRAGLDPEDGSFAWCAAFLYWCFDEAALALERNNPLVRTAGVMQHWNKAREQEIPVLLKDDAVNNPALVKPGFIFILHTSGVHGHTGIVESVIGGQMVTIEGNTNVGGSADGGGVFRRESRKIVDNNRGFIDYSGL